MDSQAATPSSLSEESCTLDLPMVCDSMGYEASQGASQGSDSTSLSSLEPHPFPSSSTADSGFLPQTGRKPSHCKLLLQAIFSDTDSNSLTTEQKGSWDSENFWLDPSSKGQVETNEEEDGLRKSLDRFYEAFAQPLPGSGDPLSAPVCQCLSQTISELEGQESQKYALRSFQMARVIFSRDGCSTLQRHSRETRFYPLEQEGSSVDDEEPTPGLSREVIRFLLEQTIMKDS
ncbi:shieldin complex subunit 1 isoform X3 [Rattus norvegicus]|uniref:Shieldin complex subunit 1 n=2 Tax=Rattus norvegicus TaxID=10116 RepID=D3ZVK4_RAT|nr:shieldin complex subunit 1 isoform X1 [Rattus norvegicus]